MMQFLFLIALIASVLTLGSAEYFKVAGEKCPTLSNSTAFFDNYLLPCAIYKSDPVEFKCLSSDEIQALIPTVPDWNLIQNSETGDSLTRSFLFKDFRDAFLFMAESAQLAEKNGHHPDWRNLYNLVEITLTTDDKSCLSTFDFELAQGIDNIVNKFDLAKKL